MVKLTDEDRKNICAEYISGSSIVKLYRKYNVGDKRIRSILIDNGINIFNPHESKNGSTYVSDNLIRFPKHDGCVYKAVCKLDSSVIFDDYLNKSGTLTAYIKNTLNINVPSLFLRKKFFNKNGIQWYEQYFDIIEFVDQKRDTKKCPYCSWETVDTTNKSGMFETHLLKEHGITKEEHLKKYPDDRDYFRLVNGTKDRKMENDENKYVTCAICGEKFARIDYRHLQKHGITKKEYIEKYSRNTVSNDLHKRLSGIAIDLNKNITQKFTSKAQQEIYDFLKENNLYAEINNRKILNGKEIDIYVPDKKIGIEYNGNFWHTTKYVDKNKHLIKTKECIEKQIRLIQIFEDEYVNNRDIVYNKIKHIFNIDTNLPKIMGRKCLIKEISINDAKIFLTNYHIQGFASSTVYLGGFYDDELIAVMTFIREGKSSLKWELNRFASNYNYICQGIGGKLFKYFINNYNPLEIKSFADRRWTVDVDNNIYIKLGFKFDKYILPDYRYYNKNIDRYMRFHKFAFRKRILSKKYGFPLTMTETEMTEKLGYFKIYDCGLIKYVWKSN